MRSWLLGLMVTCAAGAAHAQAANGQTHIHIVGTGADPSGWLNAAPVRSQMLVGSDGQTYVGVWIDTPQSNGVAQRAPLDLSLVIDNSGSMSGDKIANARMAAASMIESLATGDIVSIYAFSNDVMEIAPPTVIDASSRNLLIQRVSSIQPMGGTNLYDGLRVGESRVAQAPGTHPVRRVVVISDGQANIGPSTPEELGNLAAQGTEAGAQVSAIGVGLDYDERTLGALAVRTSGRLYHLQEPSEMASILREELQRLSHTVATEAVLEVDPAPGVQLLGVESLASERNDGHLSVRLGSLYGGQHRELLLRVRVDTSAAGEHPLASARLAFREPTGSRGAHHFAVPLTYRVSSDAAAVERSVDARVQTIVATNEASQAQLRAAEMMNQGQNREAAVVLQDAERRLSAVAAAAPSPAARQRVMQQAAQISHAHSSAAGATGVNRAGALGAFSDAYSAQGL